MIYAINEPVHPFDCFVFTLKTCFRAFSTEEGHGSISGEDSDGNMKTSSLFGGCGANNSSSSYSAVASDDRNNTLIDTHSFHQNLGITGSCYDEAGSTNENLNFNTQPTGLMSQRTLNLKDFERVSFRTLSFSTVGLNIVG